MNWTTVVNTYLAQRRQLGYTLESEGRLLLDYALFADKKKASQLSVSQALQWANHAPSGSRIAIARRFSILRPFSRYLCSMGLSSEVLPTKLIGPTHRRLPPFIFSDDDITQLMVLAESLIPIAGLRAISMRTLIGLLASTGLRPGEAVRLQRKAVNLKHGEINVLQSKGWRQRIVPLAPSTVRALQAYEAFRDNLTPVDQNGAFFLLDNGGSMNIQTVDYAFRILRGKLGLSRQINGRAPRLYDLRHSFVCRRVLAWYKTGEDVNRLMPQLSRYLGHKKIGDTYWYLSIIPELMACVSERFSSCLQVQGDEL